MKKISRESFLYIVVHTSRGREIFIPFYIEIIGCFTAHLLSDILYIYKEGFYIKYTVFFLLKASYTSVDCQHYGASSTHIAERCTVLHCLVWRLLDFLLMTKCGFGTFLFNLSKWYTVTTTGEFHFTAKIKIPPGKLPA